METQSDGVGLSGEMSLCNVAEHNVYMARWLLGVRISIVLFLFTVGDTVATTSLNVLVIIISNQHRLFLLIIPSSERPSKMAKGGVKNVSSPTDKDVPSKSAKDGKGAAKKLSSPPRRNKGKKTCVGWKSAFSYFVKTLQTTVSGVWCCRVLLFA